MVQRYEQMRRLQWYKRGAAYIYHVFLLIIMQEKPDSFTSKAKPLTDGAEAGLTRSGKST